MSDSDNVFNANFRSRLVAHKREDFATHAETVEQRAAKAAEAHAEKCWERTQVDPMLSTARAHRATNYEIGYLDGARRESALAAVAEIEKLVPLVCVHCGDNLPFEMSHDGVMRLHIQRGVWCKASELHAAIARLRAEAGYVAKEGR